MRSLMANPCEWRYSREMFRTILSLFLLASAAAAQAAPDISGNWIVQDRTGVVAIQRCGASVCGHIAKALVIKPNHPKTDVHNPSPALRNHPLIGLQILSGFEAGTDDWERGTIYDPESGKSYKSYLRLNRDGSLKVSGCVLFFCQSQRWTRR
jgi:uncharacterized protein (DUF2147 family)